MNPGIKFFVLFIFISIPVGNLFCQNNFSFNRGYIINKSGDTIDGFVSSKFDASLSFSCLFKPNKSDYITQFGPNELKGFGSYSDNKFFISTPLPLGIRDTLGFLRIVFDGTYDLLYYEISGVKHFLIREPGNTIHDITYPPTLTKDENLAGMTINKKFQQEINSYCPHISNQQGHSKEIKPKVSSFVKYFKSYHKASGEPYIIYKGDQRDLYAGFVTGITSDWYYAKAGNNGFKSFPETSPYAGIFLKLMNKNAKSGFLFQSTLGYKNHHYSYLIEDLTSKDYYETFIKSLASTSGVGYSVNPFPNASLNPFIEGGGLLSVYLNPKYDNYKDQLLTSENTAYTYQTQNAQNSAIFYGVFVRTGVQLVLKNYNLLRISGGYDFLTRSNSDRIHSVDFSIIYMMKFK